MPAGGFNGWYGGSGGSGGGGGMGGTYGGLTGSGPASQAKTLAGQALGSGSGQYSYPIGPSPIGPRPLNQSDYTPGGAAANRAWNQAQASPYAAMVNTFYGPQQQILADQLRLQKQQMGFIELDANRQTDILNRDNALALQGLGLDKQALGISKDLNSTQLANLDKLKGILKQQYGLVGETFTNQLAGLKIDESSLRDNASRKQFDLRSDLTARGAFNTVANERGTGRINRDLMYGLGQINVQRSAADIQRRGAILGLDEKGIGYANTEAGLNASLANLGLDEQRLGISSQQIANSLQDGLDAIGLGSMISIGELMAGINGTNAQSAQLLTTIYNAIAAQQGLPLLPAPGSGGGSGPAGGGNSAGAGGNMA